MPRDLPIRIRRLVEQRPFGWKSIAAQHRLDECSEGRGVGEVLNCGHLIQEIPHAVGDAGALVD
jgi:hypothetical protein